MFKNYLKTAIRTLWKNKGFSAINIIGLSVGIATCLLIILYVTDELSFDKQNTKASRIYRLDYAMKFGDNQFDAAQAASVIGPFFKKEYPQIESYVRFRNDGGFLINKGNENLKENKVTYADSSLFDVFTMPLLAGDPKTALKEPGSIVITESIAKKYFNSTDVLGKSLLINNKKNYRITGIITDLPSQSHFDFNIFVPLSEFEDSRNPDWLSQNYNTYLVLKPGTDVTQLQKQFNQTLESNAGIEMKSILNLGLDDFKKGGGYIRCSLTPLLNIHLYSNKTGELGSNGNIQYVYIFSAIGLFILLIACVNFMNLTTARSSNRAKEVGVRKVLGSLRKNLVAQFLTESLLMSFLSFLIAIVLCLLLLPLFNQLAQKNMSYRMLLSPLMIPSFFTLMVVIGLLAGSYPALYLSSFQPIAVLKGKLSNGFKNSSLRNTLVVFQFSISIILIIGTLVIFRQLSYIRSKDIGFTKDQVLVIKNTSILKNQATTFKNELLQLPGIKKVTISGFTPIDGYRNNTAFFQDLSFDIKTAISMQIWNVDEDYIPAMEIHLIKGRNFSTQFLTDSNAVIINEAAAKFLGKDPLNKNLYTIDDIATKKTIPYHVIGVIKNFNFSSLRNEVTPLALNLYPNSGSIALKISTQNIPELLAGVKSKWKAMVPSQPFQYSFLDEDFNKQYVAEQRTGKLSITFSTLAILIACLGLFGLVTYAAEQRIKEIGIRKVLGAGVPGIVTLLSKDFIKLVVIAIVIASPVAWWLMNQWLQDFAYRADIAWWIFIVAAIIALLISVITIGFQAIKAASANPVKNLRTE